MSQSAASVNRPEGQSGVSRRDEGRCASYARRAMPSPAPAFRFRARITRGDVVAIGPGKIALLEAIDECGSITAAARHLDMSYRRAWLLLDELNRSLKQPAVDSAKGGQHGGGSALTDAGRELIRLYRHIEAKAAKSCAADIEKLLALLAR
jgi:molybdate transport system regulatory protein